MAVTLISQLLVSAVLAAAAPGDAGPKTCVSPIYDPATGCKIRPGIDGWAIVQCTAARDGSLKDCTLVSESTPGQGFGEAALDDAKFEKVKEDNSRPDAGAPVKFKLHFKSAS